MKINEMEADLQRRIAQATRPWMRVLAAVLLIGGVGALLWTRPFAHARNGGSDKRHSAASAEFGEALQKAGIQTQAGPSR